MKSHNANCQLIAILLVAIVCLVTNSVAAQGVMPNMVGSLSWSPDGTELALVSDNGLFIYDRNNRLLRYQLEGIPYAYALNGWSPDGNHLLLGNRIIDAQSLQTIREIPGYPRGWIDAGRQVFTITPDHLKIINIEDGTIAGEMPLDIQIEEAFASPDGTKIATSVANGLFVFDVNRREMIVESTYAFRAIGRPVWSPDSSWIAFSGLYQANNGDWRATLNIVEANTGNLLLNYEAPHIGFLSWAAQTNRIVGVSGATNEIYVWDANTLQLLSTSSFAGEFTGDDAMLSPFGGVLAIGIVPSNESVTSNHQTSSQFLVANTLLIAVPDVSLESIQTLTDRCNLPAQTEATLDQQAATDLTAFATQVAALSNTQIPPACRADLLAVAAALQASP
jgi:WD40 repeat protein